VEPQRHSRALCGISDMSRFLAFSLLLLSLNSFGQSQLERTNVYGTIFSGYSGQPLEEGFLTFIAENGKHYWANTDSLGKYSTEELPSGRYKLNVTCFGYSEQDTIINLEPNRSVKIDFTVSTDCEFNKELALKDIESGTPKLLLVGGIAPLTNTKRDKKFERKYSIEYYDFGCNPETYECLADYNKTIAKYLDEQFGRNWRNSVRGDIIVKPHNRR